MERLGELAAFGTAIFWTASALVFEGASKRVGALAVNLWKVAGAFVLLALAGLLAGRLPLPFDAPPRSWAFLSLSGLVGFVVADYFLFNAYVLIGSRVTVVFQALTPLITAAAGWALLGETMATAALAGMATVVAGILALVLGRARAASREPPTGRPGGNRRGYLFAFLSAVFQALGLVTSKLGLGGIDAISATQIRVLVAILGFSLQALLLGQARAVFVEAPRDRPAMRAIALGAVFGPFLGVTLSLFALQRTNAGTASTLMALTPVLIIPPAILVFRQRVSLPEILGAAVAVAGTAMFFLL